MSTRPPEYIYNYVQTNLDEFPTWLNEKVDEHNGIPTNQAWFALGACFLAWALQDRTTVERFCTNCDTIVQLFMKGHHDDHEPSVDKLVGLTSEVLS